MQYEYVLDLTKIEISDPNIQGHYEIYEGGLHLGYLWISAWDANTDAIVWCGSNPYLQKNARKIGRYIEDQDLNGKARLKIGA